MKPQKLDKNSLKSPSFSSIQGSESTTTKRNRHDSMDLFESYVLNRSLSSSSTSLESEKGKRKSKKNQKGAGDELGRKLAKKSLAKKAVDIDVRSVRRDALQYHF